MVFIFHIQHMNIKTINLSNEEKNCTWGQLLKMFFSVLMHSKNLIFLSKKWITKSNYKKFIFFLLDSCQYFNLFQSLLYNSRCQIFWVWSETMCHDTKHRFWRIHDLWVRGSFFNQWKMHMSASVYGKIHDHYVMENASFIRFQILNR